MDIEKQIMELQREIKNSIEDINLGGCIHFAYFFSKRLKELKINHYVVLINYNDSELSFNYKKLHSVNHVMIFIPKIGYIDGEDTITSIPKEFNHRRGNPSIKKLDTFRKLSGWNVTYNKYQNKKLSILINSIIKG